MEGSDCDRKGKLLGGVTIFSHPWTDDASSYADNIECRLTFKAEKDDWKLMMRVVELDIPDKSFSELCNDAVYVYDASNIMGRPVVSLCRAARSHKLLVPPLPVFHQPFNVFVLGGKSNFQASCGLDFGRKKKKNIERFWNQHHELWPICKSGQMWRLEPTAPTLCVRILIDEKCSWEKLMVSLHKCMWQSSSKVTCSCLCLMPQSFQAQYCRIIMSVIHP